jgi:hypothetical protein
MIFNAISVLLLLAESRLRPQWGSVSADITSIAAVKLLIRPNLPDGNLGGVAFAGCA